MSTPKLDIVIVGGGFSGTMLAVHLLHRATSLSIGLLERRPSLGRGLAYSTRHRWQLLNVPAEQMSAFPEQPEHFLLWARANYEPLVKPRSFLPRSVYGRYIASLLKEAVAGNEHRFHYYHDEALSIRRKSGWMAIQRNQGGELLAHAVVLATGNFPPASPEIPGLCSQSTRYEPFAWSATALEEVPRDGRVLLIGSGLTSVDLVIALKAKGFKGHIDIVSRHGLLPARYQPPQGWPQFWNRQAPWTTRGLIRLFREQVERAAQQGVDWRAVIDAVRPVTQQVWQALPLAERRRFLRHVRALWETHRHRVAPEIADMLSDLITEGQVCIYAGRVIHYLEEPNFAEVTFTDRRSGSQRVVHVDRVINCTGSENDCRRINDSLVTSLFVQGLARPDPLFLGLDVDAHGALRESTGTPSQSLYTLGPPGKGCLWEITAVPEISSQVCQLAEHLLHCLSARFRRQPYPTSHRAV